MATTNTNITFKGNPTPVNGTALTVGSKLPAFRLTGQDLGDIDNTTFAGKVLIISVVPSIDTPVCATQTKRFNTEASQLSGDVAILTVSMDLPFAQKRWCGAEGVENITVASDYKYRTFGEAFGSYLPDVGLLTRAVFVADKDSTLRYIEYVDEVTDEPDYDKALANVQDLLS